MICTPVKPPIRRYIVRMIVAASLCVLFCLVAALAFRFGHVHGVPGYLLAVLPALPIMGALVVTALYLSDEKDEFQRGLLIQSLLGGMGITLSIITVWGYLEDFTHAPHLDLVWVYPMFCISVMIAYPFVWMRYR